jgi:hypothetical protein
LIIEIFAERKLSEMLCIGNWNRRKERLIAPQYWLKEKQAGWKLF